jgi:hypothetical protein
MFNQTVIEDAKLAAKKSYNEFVAKNPGFMQRDCCGFAGVIVKTPRGRRAKGNFYDYLIAEDYATKGWRPGTLDISVYKFADGLDLNQSITIREVIARAVAEVFAENGISANVWSRMD